MGRKRLSPLEWLERRRESKKRYYEKNKDVLRKKGRKYYHDHRADIRLAQKERYERAVGEEETTGLTRTELVRSAKAAPVYRRGVHPVDWGTPTPEADIALQNQSAPPPIIKGQDFWKEAYQGGESGMDLTDCENALYGDFKPR